MSLLLTFTFSAQVCPSVAPDVDGELGGAAETRSNNTLFIGGCCFA